MTKNLKFKTWLEFTDDLKKEWIYLFSLSNNSIFQSYDWQFLWFEEIKKKSFKESLMVVGVYSESKIIGIFPFELRKTLGLNNLRLTGFPFADYLDCLIDKKIILKNFDFESELLEYLKKNKKIDIIQLTNLTENSNFYQFLKGTKFKKNTFKSFQILKKENQSQMINKKFSLDTKRQIKRLSLLGKITFKIAETNNEKKEIIDFFFKHKEKQLIRTNNWNFLKNQTYKLFLKKLFTQKYSHNSFLLLNDEIIAVHLGFKDLKKMFYIFPTFTHKYYNYSPGNILLLKLVNSFFEEDGEVFDMTIGNEFYKKKLSNNSIDIYYKDIFLSFKGKLISPYLVLKNYLKKIDFINYIFRIVKYR